MSDELPLDGQSEDSTSCAIDDVVPQPPANTTIKIDRFSDGLTITVPPAGLWRGTRGLFFFALIWNGFISVITAVFVLAMFSSKTPDRIAYFIFPAFMSLFWLVGIGLLLGAINMGRRQAAIAVTAGRLMVIQSGPFGTKQRDWAAEQIAKLFAGPSGMEVNEAPVLELQIVGSDSKKFGLLAGRSDDELKWMAAELRAALSLETPTPAPSNPPALNPEP
jgi:hypothetical protein